ncbi:MAG: hypothetical protein FWG30_03315 [Eubacteriaceae bacterium]|nr:hypothetical protein [Eubacteriaceae bacterium]
MKKSISVGLAMIIALSLLSACGSGSNSANDKPSGGNSSSTPPASDSGNTNSTTDAGASPEQGDVFIKASQLIPLEDAKRIVHESFEVGIDSKTKQAQLDLPSRSRPGFTTTYSGDAFLILVVTVNYDESYIQGIKRDIDASLVASEQVDGVGDWAAFVESVGKSLYVGYKDAFLNITLTGLKSVSIAEEDMDGIFKDLGRLACENYGALK